MSNKFAKVQNDDFEANWKNNLLKNEKMSNVTLILNDFKDKSMKKVFF